MSITDDSLLVNQVNHAIKQNKFSKTQYRPLPLLPSILASGKAVPLQCFNPFNSSAPDEFWERTQKDITDCAAKLLGHRVQNPFLFLHVNKIMSDIISSSTFATMKLFVLLRTGLRVGTVTSTASKHRVVCSLGCVPVAK